MRTERFNRAYDALVKAFFEGTLKKGDCTACAVGNICLTSGQELGIRNNVWSRLFVTGSSGTRYIAGEGERVVSLLGSIFVQSVSQNDLPYIEEAKNLIFKTGYTPEELSQVEYAFETNSSIMYDEYHLHSEQKILEDQYNGLAAVVDVLLKLDNISPEDHYKNKFREHPALTN